jgi:hypothetical protein
MRGFQFTELQDGEELVFGPVTFTQSTSFSSPRLGAVATPLAGTLVCTPSAVNRQAHRKPRFLWPRKRVFASA